MRKLTTHGEHTTASASTYGQAQLLCSNERFLNQPTPAFCTGFLISPNKIVTAGHCIETSTECAETKFIFGYQMLDETTANVTFHSSDIVGCKKILGHEIDRKSLDYSIIELDRPITHRRPLTLSANTNLSVNDGLFVIGHPNGLPAKITDSAAIRSIHPEKGILIANLDTYGGNSGSPVFNSETLEVEGILVRGENDFKKDEINNCNYSNQFSEIGGRGEDVVLISRAVENGFTPVIASTELRYVWLDSDSTCNQFQGENYIQEVSRDLCSDTPTTTPRYVYLPNDNSCNEFQGQNYIREVNVLMCPEVANANARYVYLSSDGTCNEFRGPAYIREVPSYYCN